MWTNPTQESGSYETFFKTLVSSDYPNSRLDLPWGETIVRSATNLYHQNPQAAPAQMMTLVNSPPFFDGRPEGEAAWHLILSPDPPPWWAVNLIEEKAARLVQKGGLYIDPSPEGILEQVTRIRHEITDRYKSTWKLGGLCDQAAKRGYLDRLSAYIRLRTISEVRDGCGSKRVDSIECPACGRATVTRQRPLCPRCGVSIPKDTFRWEHLIDIRWIPLTKPIMCEDGPYRGEIEIVVDFDKEDEEVNQPLEVLEARSDLGAIEGSDPFLERLADVIRKEDLTLKEAAERIDISPEALYMRLHRRRKKLSKG